GSSRSTKREFEQLIAAFADPSYQQVLQQLIPEQAYDIYTTTDLTTAMEDTVQHKGWTKTYLQYHW
ncbi:dehydrogenase, partial [Staphylococcus arlettae]